MLIGRFSNIYHCKKLEEEVFHGSKSDIHQLGYCTPKSIIMAPLKNPQARLSDFAKTAFTNVNKGFAKIE